MLSFNIQVKYDEQSEVLTISRGYEETVYHASGISSVADAIIKYLSFVEEVDPA